MERSANLSPWSRFPRESLTDGSKADGRHGPLAEVLTYIPRPSTSFRLPGDMRRTRADLARPRGEVGHQAAVLLDAGLRHVVERAVRVP